MTFIQNPREKEVETFMSCATKKGSHYNPHATVAIVVAEFNNFITDALLKGCINTLKYTGAIRSENITIIRVPGAYEIPYACQKIARKKGVSFIVALGAVIRGSTPHFDYVCGPMAGEIMSISLKNDIPISFGVLTTNTIEEAIERCGTKAGNKGSDAALVGLEMYSLSKEIN